MIWTEPERFFRDRSELASEAENIAHAVHQALEIAPADKDAPRVRVSVERGEGKDAGELRRRDAKH